MVREDFFDSKNIVHLNSSMSFKCIFVINFSFVTFNMKYYKFENMAIHQLYMSMKVKDAIFVNSAF